MYTVDSVINIYIYIYASLTRTWCIEPWGQLPLLGSCVNITQSLNFLQLALIGLWFGGPHPHHCGIY